MKKHNKTALVLTYHVKNSKRVGGFHCFIRFLKESGYDIDWVTLPVSITWLLGKNDRENAKNFLKLWKGEIYTDDKTSIRCFTSPIMIPAKLAKVFNLRIGDEFWPKWEKLRKRLKDNYNVVLLEGVACQYSKALRKEYPQSIIIYRPSDILATFSGVKNPEQMEVGTIDDSDVTACVDETEIAYYKKIGADINKLKLLRNPLTTSKDIELIETFAPICEKEKKFAVYMGVSFCNFEYIEYAAERNTDCIFYVIGPFDRKSHDNIIYTGSLGRDDYEEIIRKASVAMAPTVETGYKAEYGIKYGFTGKIITYMKFLLPIVATCSVNYLDVDGFYCVDTIDEFSNKIAECLRYSVEDREQLRDGYMYAMKVFSEDESRKHFLSLVNGEEYEPQNRTE